MQFDNSYARELDGAYVRWRPAPAPNPRLVQLNHALAAELNLDASTLCSTEGVAVLAGNAVPPGAEPLAQAYAGHQFGGFSPQLGDGRALLLGEVIDVRGHRRDIVLKGSGRTPFSRGGDGKATLGPVLREFLMGEAMQALGIPTTRALAAVSTGDTVYREEALPGAVLTRVASSHLRVGTFQFFAARSDWAMVRRLADYAIARHEPQLMGAADRYLGLLDAMVERQASLIARWMGVGFIHGVMNTDNMAISGETIDYGPCAFLEHYDPKTVFSSIDTGGRYAYGNQPAIALWNLARFAETLVPLIDADTMRALERAKVAVESFAERYARHKIQVQRAKLGLTGSDPNDEALAESFLDLLLAYRIDFTLGFRRLIDAAAGDMVPLRRLFSQNPPALEEWVLRWSTCMRHDNGDLNERLAEMRRANPMYIPRNYQVERALDAAVRRNDLGHFERLLGVVGRPFEERTSDLRFAEPAPPEETAGYRTFCGT